MKTDHLPCSVESMHHVLDMIGFLFACGMTIKFRFTPTEPDMIQAMIVAHEEMEAERYKPLAKFTAVRS